MLALKMLMLTKTQQDNRFGKLENCGVINVPWPEQDATQYLESQLAGGTVACDCLCVFSSPLRCGAAVV